MTLQIGLNMFVCWMILLQPGGPEHRLEAFFDRYLAPVRSGSAEVKSSAAPAKSGN